VLRIARESYVAWPLDASGVDPAYLALAGAQAVA
jgi:hypothetical protein